MPTMTAPGWTCPSCETAHAGDAVSCTVCGWTSAVYGVTEHADLDALVREGRIDRQAARAIVAIRLLRDLRPLGLSLVERVRSTGHLTVEEAAWLSVLTGQAPAFGPPKAPAEPAIARPSWATAIGADPYGTWATLSVGGVQQVMRLIPGGAFLMGTPDERHPVRISRPFWMGDTPVTQELWRIVMGKSPSKHTPHEQLPVVLVSWHECQAFHTVLNHRVPGLYGHLPSEAQWEYACRAGDASDHEYEIDHLAWYLGNAGGRTHSVKQKIPNRWGLHDMMGNVWEWCVDWYDSYVTGMQEDPTGPRQGFERVRRGGCYDSAASACAPTYRFSDKPDRRSAWCGFRLTAPT